MTPENHLKKNHVPVAAGIRNLSPKTMVMIALLAMMGILWGRVLLGGKGGPQEASAQEAEQLLQQQSMQPVQTTNIEIDAIQLPEIPGRNDTLSGDFFSAENRGTFMPNDQNDSSADSAGQSPEKSLQLKLDKIAERLVLEAVIKDGLGNPYQAFIDGKILSVGNTLTVQEGPDQYVLTLKKMSENEVTFTCNEVSVVLKIPEMFEF